MRRRARARQRSTSPAAKGWFAHRLLDWGAHVVTGIDIRNENIRRAELVRDRLGIDAARLRLRTGDVFALDTAALGAHDVVLCLGLVYHVENPSARCASPAR